MDGLGTWLFNECATLYFLSASQAAVVELVNAERTAEGLGLAQFASSEDPQNPPEEVLGALTCADINASTIDPTVSSSFTLLYCIHVCDGAPTTRSGVHQILIHSS